MKVSYQWIKDYISTDCTPEEVSELLTSTGLEVSEISQFQSIKGGLIGLIIGEVLTCEKHPDADKLSVTTVDIGTDTPLNVVCGAPNVAAKQKVVVATVGTELYSGNESFKIKKSKIRGCVSEGMICAEDEIGLGKSHDGIMILPQDVKVGTPASEYFNIVSDIVFEVDLTANRIDAASHIGVSRDLAAALTRQGKKTIVNYPSIEAFPKNGKACPINIKVDSPEACIRYAGVHISGIHVKESPEWLKNKLKAIGLNPINNIVDITNFILHEYAQPLHAFDSKQVGSEIQVKTVKAGTKFVTLDEVERTLDANDLMICNYKEPMCLAGVFGGLHSGVNKNTTDIFLESACFNPVWVRKSARRHILNTDSSFRFERGVDPNNTINALKRAALLIQEIAGGNISEIVDIYPKVINNVEINLLWKNVTRLVGKNIEVHILKEILTSLEMKVISENEEGVIISIPSYRVDVTREADVIEDLLRIYGYNQVESPISVKSTLTHVEKPDLHKTKNTISDLLSSIGFNEIMCNSLTKESYYSNLKEYPSSHSVKILNPLSSELSVMRQTLIFGGLESISFNKNRKQQDLKLYEFGNCYQFNASNKKENDALSAYTESQHLALWITGKNTSQSWIQKQEDSSIFDMKAYVKNILIRMGVDINKLQITINKSELFSETIEYRLQDKLIVSIGTINSSILNSFDISSPVFYANIDWDTTCQLHKKYQLRYQEITKFPEVKRDLSLLVDKKITFNQLEQAAYKAESKLLKKVGLFDVYEGKNLPEGKISYALSFILQDNNNTLVDKQIEKIMNKLIRSFETEFGAQLR